MFEKIFQGIDGFSQAIKETIKEVFEDMGEKRKNIAQISTTLGEVQRFTKDANDKLSQNSTSLEKINESIASLGNKVGGLDSALQNADRKNSELNSHLQATNADLEKVKAESNNKSVEISTLNNDISSRNSTISDLTMRIKNGEAEIGNLKNELAKKEASLQASQTENTSLSEYKTRIENSVSPFREILKYCYECGVLDEEIKKIGLSSEFNENDYDNIFSFIAWFGKETTFALVVHSAIKKARPDGNPNPSPLTEAEKRLINRLNSFYKARLGYAFDVLDMLVGQEEFNNELMRDVRNQAISDPPVKKVHAICVPVCYRPDGKTVEAKAYVLGD